MSCSVPTILEFIDRQEEQWLVLTAAPRKTISWREEHLYKARENWDTAEGGQLTS